MTGKSGFPAGSGKKGADRFGPAPGHRGGSPGRGDGRPPFPGPQRGTGARTPVIRVTPIQKPAQTMFPSTIPRKKGRRRR